MAARDQHLRRAGGRRKAPLLQRLASTRRILADAHARLSAGAARQVDVGPAGEWLLDNFHVVQEHIRDVQEALPRGYYRELPELASGRLSGYPRVYEVAIALISHSESRVGSDNLELFLTAYQAVTPLSIGELWALPAMFRLGLIESVRRMTLRTLARMEELERADAWAARIENASARGAESLAHELDEFMRQPPRLTDVFVARLLHQLRQTRGSYPPLAELEQWISERGRTDEAATARATQHLALTQVMMANSITSLRTLAHMDWRTFVERQSVLDAVLRDDPSTFYTRMTFGTRDHYRHVVERIARRTKRAEPEVAQLAITLARAGLQQHGAGHVRAHVGYYLVDDGLAELEQATSYRPRLRESMRRVVLRHPGVTFGTGVLTALALTYIVIFQLAEFSAPALLFAFIPALHVAIAAVDLLVTTFMQPRTLPSLELRPRADMAPGLRTAIVIPTLFDSVATVEESFDHLEVQYLANRGARLHYAVLSDFTDADCEHCDGDDAIVAAAVTRVQALNAQYAPGTDDTFFLFHRARRWNAGQGVWMGWERKRGKLAEFNRFLRGGASGAFATITGNVMQLRTVRYVITLDSDTMLPPGSAAELVGTMAHPLNRAVYDDAAGRVVRGYGILQPRVGVSLPSAHRSHFAAIHSGHPGVDPYSSASSDVYQDLFGEGSFTGKGIYDVDVFERATHGRFPENTLLSHDLIEGSYARAGLVTAISVYDEYPTRYLTYTRRKHRWIRGDWQLLRWLTPHVPGPDGIERNRLPLLARWKILDNLRRSTVEIGQLLFLFAGWTLLPGAPLAWTAVAVGAIAAPWLMSLLLAALRPPLDRAIGAHYAAIGRDALTSVQQVVLTIAFLPHQAWTSADAVLRTLWRLMVTRRNLLEWQSASTTERAVGTGSSVAWRALGPPSLFATAMAVLAAVSFTWTTAALVVGSLLAACWLAAPLLAHALNAPAVPRPMRWSEAQRATLIDIARRHWHFFDSFVTAETQWLAPDNFQEDPEPVVAMRTSPTNIGLQLLALGSAHDLGFITCDEMTRRVELVFRSLERMRRFRGHFFNWYDLHELRVLEPAYISTVDSGNLAGHLLAMRQACLAARAATPDESLRSRLDALAARAGAYLEEMDFSFLFDDERELFSIGFQHDSQTLDSSFYDLLASESRLASFLAVARNDVPLDHWFQLGRSLTQAGGATALVSWSGSMFEYLMPVLVMRAYPLTLLEQTGRGAVRRHIAHGAKHRVPWGVSESAYNVRDRQLTYQYRAFGVPDLALKRGLGRELVIAPYASALAIMVEPARALANMNALTAAGALGDYGFRDAIDYTRPDVDGGPAIVGNYMAHHVGMSLAAITNALCANVWQDRFHADAMVRSAELLLHERIPRRVVLQPPKTVDEVPSRPETESPAVRAFTRVDTARPHVALLGRQPYTVMVSHAGAGFSRYEDLAVTRWRADATTDDTGQFCYLRDVGSGRIWSAAHQPVCAPADAYHAMLATDRVTLHRSDGDIETRTEITVVPEDAAEVRCVTVINHSTETRDIELTSYGEVVLGSADGDRAHPAFANLFVQTEWHGWCSAITATRRPRSASERTLWCVHVVDTGPAHVGTVSWETDRARFIGRGRSTRAPAALQHDAVLSGTTGAVLDPIFALRTTVRLAPGESASVAFTTLVATSRERAFELADRYHDPHTAQRALDLAWTSQQVELRDLGISPTDAAVFQELAGCVLFPDAKLRAPQHELLRNEGAQPMLWALGISGDRPIVLATLDGAAGLGTLRQVYAAHHFWRRRGISADLVILYSHPASYLQELHDRIMEALFASSDAGLDQPGGVFVRNTEALDAASLLMLRATARLIIPCDGRSLAHVHDMLQEHDVTEVRAVEEQPRIIERQDEQRPFADRRTHSYRHADVALGEPMPARRAEDTRTPTGAARDDLALFNGIGGLDADGDYVMGIGGDVLPPAPWVNVVANERGGFVVSERGAGFTWADSSYFYRLTPWHNDPVADPVSDVIYLEDEETGARWTATPAPIGSAAMFTVTHGAGCSSFESEQHGVGAHVTLAMAGDEPVRVSLLRLTNRSGRTRRLRLTAYVEWALGARREHTQHHVRTHYDAALGAILARNCFDPQFEQHTAFLSLTAPVTSHTSDRAEFLGRNGSVHHPAGLDAAALSGACGIGLDPCAALQCAVELQPGETREVTVLLGALASETLARDTLARLRGNGVAAAAAAGSTMRWRDRLQSVQVRTPEPSFDAMINRWLAYQTLACRMWARSALYQSSGAWGFRDQLQDVLALTHAEPAIARAHILRAAARQFLEGDVQHWWHPQSGRGVRTRFSDDLVWLPWVVDEYVRRTDDAAVLDEYVPFLDMRALEPHEHELYDLPRITDEHGSIYEHCMRALRRACTSGPHGLPLIGTGDWNDGMSRVGMDGRGESVWLAWFLVSTLRAFAVHAAQRGEEHVADEMRARADDYVAAIETHAWDGAWYRRAFFDDGTPLGSTTSDECRIDSIAQSWSVISGAGSPERQAQAMRSLEQHLVDDDARLLMLLAPPFDHTPNDPGYIKGYLPGVRENGAQYTHAAVWAVIATAMRGDGDRAFELFQMINPLTHALTPADVATYKVEPYVVAADVYTAEGQLGRGGWTWYTGAAGWLYRAGLESILGITRHGGTLRIQPRVPAHWPEFRIDYRFGGSSYAITVLQPGMMSDVAIPEILLDGVRLDSADIPLTDDGAQHAVLVRPRA